MATRDRLSTLIVSVVAITVIAASSAGALSLAEGASAGWLDLALLGGGALAMIAIGAGLARLSSHGGGT